MTWKSLFSSIWHRPQGYENFYFANLLASFNARTIQCTDIAALKNRADTLSKALQNRPEDPALTCELELLSHCLSGAADLALTVRDLRSRWVNLNGVSPEIKTPEPVDLEALRAEAKFLTVQIHRHYGLQQLFDANKRWALLWMFLCLPVALILLELIPRKCPDCGGGIIGYEMMAGILGGYTSCFLRVYRMTPGSDLVTGIQAARFDAANLLARPAMGAIFAVLLHFLFMSGSLSGGMFPKLAIEGVSGEVLFLKFLQGKVIALP